MEEVLEIGRLLIDCTEYLSICNESVWENWNILEDLALLLSIVGSIQPNVGKAPRHRVRWS